MYFIEILQKVQDLFTDIHFNTISDSTKKKTIDNKNNRNTCICSPKKCVLECSQQHYLQQTKTVKYPNAYQGWMDKLRYSHTREYYIATRIHKRQPPTTIWKNPTDIMLNKTSVTRKRRYFMKPLMQKYTHRHNQSVLWKDRLRVILGEEWLEGIPVGLSVLVMSFPHNSYGWKMRFLWTLTFYLM